MDHSPDADRALLQRVAHGNPEALEALYERYSSPLVSYLARLTGDPAGAPDLLQELFLVVWRDADRYRGDGSVQAWLFGIGHKLGLMALRRRQPELLDEEAPAQLPDDGHDPADLASWALQKERLAAVVAALPPAQRAVIELVFYHGLSRAEVAAVLDCPLGTVKSRLHYALRTLAGRMDEAER
jgi:RNA polymerase sigma-70 factor (ECF subfamily)